MRTRRGSHVVKLIFFVLLAMRSLAPGRDHSESATAITRVLLEERPLFANDEDRLRTAALVVAIAFRESSFRNDAVGDHGRARCLFQLWNAPIEVLTDVELCTRIGLARMRESIAACGMSNALGIYAAGPNGCSSNAAKRISTDRLWLAKRLVAGAP